MRGAYSVSCRFNRALLLGRLTAPPKQLQTKNGKLFPKVTIAGSVAQRKGGRL